MALSSSDSLNNTNRRGFQNFREKKINFSAGERLPYCVSTMSGLFNSIQIVLLRLKCADENWKIIQQFTDIARNLNRCLNLFNGFYSIWQTKCEAREFICDTHHSYETSCHFVDWEMSADKINNSTLYVSKSMQPMA